MQRRSHGLFWCPADMGDTLRTIETLRAQPVATGDRVVAAWADAHPVVRRATVAAGVTSAALSTAVAVPTGVRWSIAAAGVVMALAAMVDVHEHKLPNRLLLGALVAVVAGVAASANAEIVMSALVGLVVGGGLMLLVRLTRGVGMGDVKMAGVVGASVGAVNQMAAPIAIAIAALAAALYGLMSRRRRLPLGPALWLGWALALAACVAGWLS